MSDADRAVAPPSDRTLAAPSRVRVKICGITTRRDVEAAARFFADAVGFVFARESPRRVTVEEAAELSELASVATAERENGPIDRFGVFVNAPNDEMLRVAAAAKLSVLQLHGEESPEQVAELLDAAGQIRVVKALRASGPETLERLAEFPGCWAYLLDACVPGRRGGTGETFNWDLAAQAGGEGEGSDRDPARSRRIILAGGLRPDNVASAIAAARPFMVDVSSGVEEHPRRKDHNFMLSFLGAARRAAGRTALDGKPEPGRNEA